MARRYKIKSRPRHYVERDKFGRFKKWTSIRRSQAADKRVSPAKTTVKPGYGHQGDQKRRKRR